MNSFIQTPSFDASEVAMYSASHVDPATTLSLELHQLTAPPFNKNMYPVMITHKYRGSQQFSISKSVEPNEELKAEQIFPQVLSTTDTTLRTLDVRFT
mgnify:CR=1 FL=1